MSDQPKPRKQDAATPTTGEWTHGMAVVQDGVPIPIPYVAVDMHNASLAEAWKDGFLKDKSDMLEAALASERELGQQECNRLDAFWQNELARQLAAEREKTEAYRDLWHGQQTTTSEHLKTILQLRSQLSAAQAFIEQCKNAMTGTGSWSLGDTEHTALDAAIAEAVDAKRGDIWREAPDQPDVQEAVIKKLDLVHRHAIEKAVAEATTEILKQSHEWREMLEESEATLATERMKVQSVSRELELAMEAMIENKQLREQLKEWRRLYQVQNLEVLRLRDLLRSMPRSFGINEQDIEPNEIHRPDSPRS